MSRIRGCVFDAYGTLLDLTSAVAPHSAALGPGAPGFLALWRAKQLEYTWLRTLMGRHADFAQVVADALDYACAATGSDSPGLRQALLRGFERLAPYPDARVTLERLRALGLPSVVLSNGTPAMLDAALEANGLAPLLDAVLSVEPVGRYKPAPAVYALATEALGATAEELLFVSANAWDVAGAGSAGLVTAWINRTGSPAERLPEPPSYEVTALSAVPKIVAAE